MIYTNYTKIYKIDDFQKYINTSEVVNYFCNNYNLEIILCKKILSAFYIYGYCKEFKPIFYASKYLVNYYFENNIFDSNFIPFYLDLFNIYIEDNKNEIKSSLIRQYCGMISVLPELDIEIQNDMNNEIEKVRKRMKSFNINYEQLNEHNILSSFEHTGFEFIGDEIEIELKKAYWSYITERSLTELVEHFCTEFIRINDELVRNNEDMKNYIINLLDYELINQMITNNAFSFYDFHKLTNKICNYLIDLDSPIGSIHLQKWLNNFNLMSQCAITIIDVIYDVLKDLLNKITYVNYIKNLILDE